MATELTKFNFLFLDFMVGLMFLRVQSLYVLQL